MSAAAAFDDHELLSTLSSSPAATLWLARNPAGALVELLAVENLHDDVDEAFFRGDVVPAWERLARLAQHDARLPLLCDKPFRADGRNIVPFAHRGGPCLAFDDLHARALADGGLALPLVLTLARDLAGALAALHDAGMIHGELRAGNVAATAGGGARILTAFLEKIPFYRDVIGFPPQLSTIAPEVLAGKSAGAAADVYALGLLIFELAAGAYAFEERTNLARAVEEVLSGPRRRLREGRADLPEALDELVAQMTHVDPQRRASLADVMRVLDGDVAWARWTQAQAAAELRALFPEVWS